MIATCYARVSTDDQYGKTKCSIPDQVKWAKEIAHEKGWTWHEEYIEPGVFGDVEIEDREALSRVMADGKKGEFDVLLIWHSSRLSREPDIGMKVCRVLGQHQVQVSMRNCSTEIVEKEKFSWGDNIGSKYMTAFSLIGDLQENVVRGERVRESMAFLANSGILRNAPFGYKKIRDFKANEDGKIVYTWNFVFDPITAPIVRGIFQEYLKAGGSIRSIMIQLNEKSTISPSGKKTKEGWYTATIKNILTNPAYIGYIRWGRKLGGKYKQGKSQTSKQKRVIAPTGEWIFRKGNQPAMIDIDVFNLVQEKLKTRRILHGRAVGSVGLLTGILKCGKCGRNTYYKTRVSSKINKNLRKGYYACSSYYRSNTCQCYVMDSNKIHSIIFDQISKLSKDKQYRSQILEQEDKSKVVRLEKELSELLIARNDVDEKLKRTLVLYQNKYMKMEEYGKARETLDVDSMKIEEGIREIRKTLSDSEKFKLGRKRFLDLIKNFDKEILTKPSVKQKEFLQSVLESVIVNGKKIKINYRLS